jgi:hypothetical protein
MSEGETALAREDAKMIGLVGLAYASSHFYHPISERAEGDS